MLDTGFPRADVENDFLRARRRQFLATLARRLRGGRGDRGRIVPLDDVVCPLGWRGERQLGLQAIPVDTIIGTVSSRRDFDRRFRPTTGRVRERWERLALAQRRGESIPPIDVYQIGDLYFEGDYGEGGLIGVKYAAMYSNGGRTIRKMTPPTTSRRKWGMAVCRFFSK